MFVILYDVKGKGGVVAVLRDLRLRENSEAGGGICYADGLAQAKVFFTAQGAYRLRNALRYGNPRIVPYDLAEAQLRKQEADGLLDLKED